MKKRTVIFMLIAFCIMFSSCGINYKLPEDIGSTLTESGTSVGDKLPIEENDIFGDGEGQSLGFIQHSAVKPQTDDNGGKLLYLYDGEEMSIDYSFQVDGKGESIGFLMFVNGEAQAYRVDSSQDLEYCHLFETDGKAEREFTFHFFPVNGKKGENINLEVVSIFNPSFVPDMADTTSYGWYHRIVSNCYIIQMEQDAPSRQDIQQDNVIKNIKCKTKKVTKEYLETNLAAMGWSSLTTESLNGQTYYEILYNGKITYDNIKLEKGDKLHISYSLCGSPGVEYVSTLFIGHVPVKIGDLLMMQTKLSKGDVSTWEIELDTGSLPELSTFYIISVPRNAADYPDVNAMVIKTDSICLFKED